MAFGCVFFLSLGVVFLLTCVLLLWQLYLSEDIYSVFVCARACRSYSCVWPRVSHAVAQVRACATVQTLNNSSRTFVHTAVDVARKQLASSFACYPCTGQDRRCLHEVLGVCTTAPTAVLLHLHTCSALRWKSLVRCCRVVLSCRPVVLTLGMVLAVALWFHLAVVVSALASSAAVTHPRYTCASPQLPPCCTLYQQHATELCRGVPTPESRPTVALLSVTARGGAGVLGSVVTPALHVSGPCLSAVCTVGREGTFRLCFVDRFKFKKLLVLSSESSLCI
jgi:hypothetical protein